MANPRYTQGRMPLMAYDPRFQPRASEPNPMLAQLMQWLLANHIAQQAEQQTGAPEVVQQADVVEPRENPYIGNIYRQSPPVGRLSPLGRFNDMGNRLEAEKRQRWADAKMAVQNTYDKQRFYDEEQHPNVPMEIGKDSRGTFIQTPYGTGFAPAAPIPGVSGSNFDGVDGGFRDWQAQQHHNSPYWNRVGSEFIPSYPNAKPAVPPVGWDDPGLMEDIARLTKAVTGRR